MENGKATTYGMMGIEDRGTLFVEPGTEIYEGMIVGENTRDNDITVNITKINKKQISVLQIKTKRTLLKKPRILTLEEALEYLVMTSILEVTPESIRLRKQILDKNERENVRKRKKR